MTDQLAPEWPPKTKDGFVLKPAPDQVGTLFQELLRLLCTPKPEPQQEAKRDEDHQ